MPMSKGEELIARLLSRAGYTYEREYIIPDVKGKKPLRYDFAVLDRRGNIQCLIEFEGRQHYEYTPYFHENPQAFYRYQEHDRIKINACLARGLPLHIIPYTEEENLKCADDLFQPKFLPKAKWHNDYNNPLK